VTDVISHCGVWQAGPVLIDWADAALHSTGYARSLIARVVLALVEDALPDDDGALAIEVARMQLAQWQGMPEEQTQPSLPPPAPSSSPAT
jgi:hypothetical protein